MPLTPEREAELRKLASLDMRDALAEVDRLREVINFAATELSVISFKRNPHWIPYMDQVPFWRGSSDGKADRAGAALTAIRALAPVPAKEATDA